MGSCLIEHKNFGNRVWVLGIISLDFVHRLTLLNTRRFWKLDLFLSSGKMMGAPTLLGPLDHWTSTGNCEFKHHKPWSDEECSKLADRRKQAKLPCLQDPSEVNADNFSNVCQS
jgi:hypothetical protein